MNVPVRAVLAAVCTSGAAGACPNCDAGRQAWEEVMRQSPALPLLGAAVPFALIGAICLLVERAGSRR